ncbi:unnamed protein product, partial [Mesorhabditis spiculigera]
MHSTSPSSTASPAEETPMLTNGERKAFRGVTDYKKALHNEEGISTKMTYINFIRGMVGPGCFSIPLSLKFAGLGTGLTLLFAIGFIATLNMSKLVKSSQYLTVLSGGKALNYGNMVEKAFEQGPRSVRRWAPKAKFFVNSCLCLLQLGVCGVCYIFMTSHLKETYLLIFMCLPFCLLVTIRSFKYLSYVSLAGNVLMITALVIIFQGHAVVLPLENQLRDRARMNGPFGVLSLGMSTTTFIYALCGFAGYRVYGNNVQGSITLNMPHTRQGPNAKIKASLGYISSSTSFSQLSPIRDSFYSTLCCWICISQSSKSCSRIGAGRRLQYERRMALALLVPNLSEIIPLVGATCGMLLALIVPPIVETVAFYPRWSAKETPAKLSFRLIGNAVIVSFGLIFMILGVKSNLEHSIGH